MKITESSRGDHHELTEKSSRTHLEFSGSTMEVTVITLEADLELTGSSPGAKRMPSGCSP